MTATEPARTARDRSGTEPYGIVVSKDVMVEMRDGIRLATDLHRPGRDGAGAARLLATGDILAA